MLFIKALSRQRSSCYPYLFGAVIVKRKILLFLCLLCLFLQSNATIKTAIANAGQGWSNASNWSPSGVPQNGDTIVVPVGMTISVKGQIYSLPYPKLLIKIFGTLDFDPSGKIDLSPLSAIGIFVGAHLTTNGTSSEIITIGGSTKFNGQLDGNLDGPKYASASTGTSPGGFVPGVLPIRLLSFNYKIIGSKVTLLWTVVQESDKDKYELQQLSDAGNWVTLSIFSPSGMPGETATYSFENTIASNKVNFYRLNLLSIDGISKYSKVLAVKMYNASSSINIFPNPVSSVARLQWNDVNDNETRIVVVDNLGKIRISKTATGNFSNLDIKELSNGIYNVLLFANTRLKNSGLLLVRK